MKMNWDWINGQPSTDGSAEADEQQLPRLVLLSEGFDLPPGLVLCECCEEDYPHSHVKAYDGDLEGFVCGWCVGHMARAEFVLISTDGLRRPELVELGGMSGEG